MTANSDHQTQSPNKAKFNFLRFLGSFISLGIKLSLIGLVVIIGFALYLDPTVQTKFNGKKWTIPAKVYARPLELYAGQNLSLSDLIFELEALGYRRQNEVSLGSFKVDGASITLHSRGFHFYEGAEPPQIVSISFKNNQISKITAKNNADLSVMRLEPLLIGGIYPAHVEDRILIKLDEVPQYLLDTLIAVEDRRFYHHFGIAPKSIARAVWVNLTQSGVRQGASTLTQQLVKNFFLTSERSLKRKATEAVMALLLELHYSKDEILETYLNEVYFGQDGQRAIHGFGLASQYYFGTPLNELKLHQVALLVGMVKGPGYYNPRKFKDRALQRRNVVLEVLAKQNIIDAKTANAAKNLDLGITERGSLAAAKYPAFLDMVKRQLRDDYQEQDLTKEGLSIFTSFNPILQHKAEQAITETLAKLSNRKKAQNLESAMVVTNPQNGEVLALIGGSDARFAGFNRALDASRQIGSLMKPAIYLTALSNPSEYTLTTVLSDTAITITPPKGKSWTPHNYDQKEHGDIFLFQALSHSYNLSATRLGMAVGVPQVLATIGKLGVDVDWPNYPAILLGSGAMTPLQVAKMYQTIASGGFNTPIKPIRSVINLRGDPLKNYPFVLEQKFDPAYIYLLQEAMQLVMRQGTGRSVYNKINKNINLAGKTGTTNDYKDSWFAGFGQNLLSVVWLGHDDNKSSGLTGATGALQVWNHFMQAAGPLSLEPIAPPNIVYVHVDAATGNAVSSDCPNVITMPYIRGSEPAFIGDCYPLDAFDQVELLDEASELGLDHPNHEANN